MSEEELETHLFVVGIGGGQRCAMRCKLVLLLLCCCCMLLRQATHLEHSLVEEPSHQREEQAEACISQM